ncbi:hypothetical protein ACQQ6W_11685 [Lysinibacillus fusiformis]
MIQKNQNQRLLKYRVTTNKIERGRVRPCEFRSNCPTDRKLPEWNAVGVEPPQSLKDSGWQPGMKPSAQHMNWLLNRAYKCILDLQQNGGNIEELEQSVHALENKISSHVDDVASHTKWIETVGGIANALTATVPGITSYKNGLAVSFPATSNSTAAVTLNINGLGAIPIKNLNGVAVSNLKASGVYTVRYRAGAFILQGESEVEIGKQIIKPSTTKQTILKGLHDGTGYVEGDSNLTASNILADKPILMDMPKSAEQEQIDALTQAVAELSLLVGGGA